MTSKRILVIAGPALLLALAGCRSAHVTSAMLYIDQQMYDRAIDVLHEGLEYSPNEADAYFYLGEAHTKQAEVAVRDNDFLAAKRNYSTAYDYYQKAKAMAPALAERVQESLLYSYVLRNNDAKTEYQGQYYEAAEGQFRLAYAALPDSIAPIKNLARMKIKLATETGENQALCTEALELLDQVLAANPGAYELLSDKANVLGRLGRKDEAAAIYIKLLEDHPNDAPLMIDIANLSQEQKQYDRAADLLVRVMTIYETDEDVANDEDIYLLSLQAAALYSSAEVHRYPEALTLFEKALYLEPVQEEGTLLQKLLIHYKYGDDLETAAAAETDPTRQADLKRQAAEQFAAGVSTGETLVGQYFESANGFFYLALCHQKLGHEKQMEEYMATYHKLSGEG
jgi:tetratricopeptide (TPR) repeat protein